MSEKADHLWSYLSRPENRGTSIIKPCCSLPQSAHDGVTWAELLAVQAWAHDDIPLLETASRHAAALRAAPADTVRTFERCMDCRAEISICDHAVQRLLDPERSFMAGRVEELQAEVERVRAVLREIARTATQGGDTAFGGRLCHQIEQMARATLAE